MFRSLTRSSSDNFLKSNMMSSYSFLSGSFLGGSRAGSSFYPNWLSSERIDGTFRQSMDNRKLQNDLSNKEGSNEIRLSDVHSSSSGDLKRDEYADEGPSWRDQAWSVPVKAEGKLYLRDFPKEYKKVRSNSTDFAFSEANEASRIEMSTATSPKAIKEFLMPEERKEKEDDVESILMRIMK